MKQDKELLKQDTALIASYLEEMIGNSSVEISYNDEGVISIVMEGELEFKLTVSDVEKYR